MDVVKFDGQGKHIKFIRLFAKSFTGQNLPLNTKLRIPATMGERGAYLAHIFAGLLVQKMRLKG